jgi:hypothetical protein
MFLCSILDLERSDDGFSYGNNVSVLQLLFLRDKVLCNSLNTVVLSD